MHAVTLQVCKRKEVIYADSSAGPRCDSLSAVTPDLGGNAVSAGGTHPALPSACSAPFCWCTDDCSVGRDRTWSPDCCYWLNFTDLCLSSEDENRVYDKLVIINVNRVHTPKSFGFSGTSGKHLGLRWVWRDVFLHMKHRSVSLPAPAAEELGYPWMHIPRDSVLVPPAGHAYFHSPTAVAEQFPLRGRAAGHSPPAGCPAGRPLPMVPKIHRKGQGPAGPPVPPARGCSRV